MRIDENSPTWRAIKVHLEERLARCREKNDSPKLDLMETEGRVRREELLQEARRRHAVETAEA